MDFIKLLAALISLFIEEFRIYPVLRYKLYMIADEKSFSFPGKSVSFSDLEDVPMVLPNATNPLCRLILQSCREEKIVPKVAANEASAKTLAHLVHRGQGIGFIPENSAGVTCRIYPHMGMYRIEPEKYFDYSLIAMRDPTPSRHVRRLIEYVAEKAENNIIPDSI